MPWIFNVPASKASGIHSGCSRSKDRIPLPPTLKGGIFTWGSTQIPPVPWGPINPLCPVKQRTSICIFFISIIASPALWDASSTNKSPCLLHSFPISSAGKRFPVTFEAWVQITAAVLARTAFSISSREKFPFLSTGSMVSSAPSFSFLYKGRSTELCSAWVVITWFPFFTSPLIAIFSASVALPVKATDSPFQAPKNSAAFSLTE